MATRVHRPLKIVAFNANGISRQRHEFSKQLQDQKIDVALLSETHLKPHERFYIPNYFFYRTDRFPGRKGGTAVAIRKGIPHTNVDLAPLVSVEATGVYIPIGNNEVFLAAVYKSPSRTWNDADIMKLLTVKHKTVLAGDLNAKNPFWNSATSNPSGAKLLHLFDNDFEISAPQSPTHYSPAGNGDVLDIVVHQNVRLSEITVSDTLDSDHLPIIFHVLEHVRTRETLAQVEKLTDWDRFQSLSSELISPKLTINSELEADKAVRDFTASISSAYKLSTHKVTLYELNNNLPGLDRLLREKQRFRKLWQETRDPVCKMVMNWVSRAIKRMARKTQSHDGKKIR